MMMMEENGTVLTGEPPAPSSGGNGARVYEDEVHMIRVPKPLEGERLGLTVQEENGCVVVTRVLSGGLVDQVGTS